MFFVSRRSTVTDQFWKRGRVSLKGFDGPVQAFEVVWRPSESVSSDDAPPDVVSTTSRDH